jgi:endo-1,4-beta-mannosidase
VGNRARRLHYNGSPSDAREKIFGIEREVPFGSAGERLDEAVKAIGEAPYGDRRITMVKKKRSFEKR